MNKRSKSHTNYIESYKRQQIHNIGFKITFVVT